MTAIVGLVRDGVWLGADSSAANDSYKTAIAGSKIVDLNTGSHNLALGYTYSFRFGQILQYATDAPHDNREDPEQYLVRDFVPAIRESLSSNGWLQKKNEREEIGQALIGYRGRLFALHSDLSVQETRGGLDAVGSGSAYALGAMWAALENEKRPQEALYVGLSAAALFDPFVMEPFHIRRVV